MESDPLAIRLAELTARNEALRRENEALRDERRKLAALLDVMNDWAWEVDERAVYTWVSPRIQEFLGYTPEEAIGKTPFDFMPPDEVARVAAIFVPIAAERRPFGGLENVNLHKDGRRIHLETSGAPIFDRDGVFRGYRGVDRDVTERRRAEEERLRMQEAIIRAQADALAQLEAPLIPVGQGVLVMPLVGAIEEARARRIIEVLLSGVAGAGARAVIVDVTGMPAVSAHVVALLLQGAQGARMLGAKVLLTGMRPEVARTLVETGLDLADIEKLSTLERGIARALGMR